MRRIILYGIFGLLLGLGLMLRINAEEEKPAMPVLPGYRALPEQRVLQLQSPVGGRLLALYISDAEYEPYLRGELTQLSRYLQLYPSALVSAGSKLGVEDFRGIKELVESDFFIGATARLLGSRYTRGEEFAVESLYDEPEGVVGYMLLEPDYTASVNTSSKRVRIIYQFLLAGELYSLEYAAVTSDITTAMAEAERCVWYFCTNEVVATYRVEAGGRRIESAAYPGLSEFEFALELPAGWAVRHDPERERLLVLEPGDKDSGVDITISSLSVPVSAGIGATEAQQQAAELFYELAEREGEGYSKELITINGYSALREDYTLTETGQNLRTRREVITIFAPGKALKLAGSLVYASQAASEEELESRRKKLASALRLMLAGLDFVEDLD